MIWNCKKKYKHNKKLNEYIDMIDKKLEIEFYKESNNLMESLKKQAIESSRKKKELRLQEKIF